MTCREFHQQLLRVPSRDRGTAWYVDLNKVVKQRRRMCDANKHMYLANYFADEPDKFSACPFCKH